MDDFMGEQPHPLSLLNVWPLGTVGRQKDNVLIAEFKELGEKYGIERISTICNGIERIWRNPQHPEVRSWIDPCTRLEVAELDSDPQLTKLLNERCQEHGYGRVPQLASIMADLMLRPETIAKYEDRYTKRMAMIAETWRHYDRLPPTGGVTPTATKDILLTPAVYSGRQRMDDITTHLPEAP